MERMKVCRVCGENLPITAFSKKGKKKWKSFCKACKPFRNEMLKKKKIEVAELDKEGDIEVRGKRSNGKRYSYFVPYEKARQMVDGKTAYIVNNRLIRKYFDRKEFRLLLFEKYNGKCWYCGNEATTIDHIIPKSSGGISSLSNCVPACLKCNEVKRSLAVDNFLFYFEPSTTVPDESTVEHVRRDLLELTGMVDHINTYLNTCLKKLAIETNAVGDLKELNALQEKVNQLDETIRRNKEEPHRAYLVQ